MNADDLKAGNPALTDECTAYGLKRAAEIVAKHATWGAGVEAFRAHYPGAVHLADIQLAAICAEAYRAGVEDGRSTELREHEEAGNKLHAAITGPWASS